MKQFAARRKLAAASSAAALAALTLSGCTAASGNDDVVTLDFFQFKPEAVGNFEEIIADFEAANPGIDVVQNHVPDADTAIRTLLVKNKTPDVLTLNANGNYGLLAEACVFADLTDLPSTQAVLPAVQDIVQELGSCNGSEINALPFANNASGIIYNKDIFEEYGAEVPGTWDELIALADMFEANGVTPFYTTLKDGWTVSPAFVNLGGALQPEGFYDALQQEETSFSAEYEEAMEKVAELFSYGQENSASRDYNAGNAAFANGESAMYLQGSYAIPPIRAANPEANIGTFPYPATNDPEDTVVVSGVDVGISIGRDTEHPEEARRFVEFMMSPEIVERYSEAQSTFSPLAESPSNTDPALEGLAPYFESGRIIGFIDHQIPPSLPLPAYLQEFILSGNTENFLAKMDNEWDKIAERTITREEARS